MAKRKREEEVKEREEECALHDRWMKFPRPEREEEKFQVIYADPAWSYRDKGTGNRWAGEKYDLMSDKELEEMPVREIAAKDAVLFLWVTFPKLEDAFSLIRAWGFTYKTCAFTWVKKTRSGEYAMGMGNWTRSNAEICLLAVKGRPKRASASVRQVIDAQRREHSRKPDEARQRIEELCGQETRKVELFARQKNPGWEVWGNQV